MTATMQGCYALSILLVVLLQNTLGFAEESKKKETNDQGTPLSRNRRGLNMLRLGKRAGSDSLPSPWPSFYPYGLDSIDDLLDLSPVYASDELPYVASFSPLEPDDESLQEDDVVAPPSQLHRFKRSLSGAPKDASKISSDSPPEKPEHLDVVGVDELTDFYPYVPFPDEEINEFLPVDEETTQDEDEKRGLNMLRLGKRQIPMLRMGKRQIRMLRLGKRGGLSMLRLGKKDTDWSPEDDEADLVDDKRGLNMLRLGKKDIDWEAADRDESDQTDDKRGLNMLRLGKRESLDDDLDEVEKRGMAMLRLGKRPMSMLRLGKRPMSMLRLGKRPMSMLRLGKRPMSMLRLGKRPMSMLRLGKRPMSMLRLGKRPMSMLRLGKRPMSMLRLGKRSMSMLRLGKRPMSMLRLGKRPMSMLRLGKRPMSMLRLGKRPMSMLRLGKRPMSMLRLGKRPMSMLRLGKRQDEVENDSDLDEGSVELQGQDTDKRLPMLRLGKRSST